ncbi:HNH endonuclease [Pedobacter sp. AW1-32]|uniref:HNH endonuclease n=1 Tax=Pedobacter sp. AW1-32 TaxID=3383026 RepID=UPI003FF04F05
MAKTKLSPKQEAYIRANYLKKGNADIAIEIGIGEGGVSGYKKRNNLIVPKEVSRSFAAAKALMRTSCSPEDDAYITNNYLSMPPQQIADVLECSEVKIKTRMRQLNLVVPREIIEQRIRDSWIPKGNISFNKGKKQSEYMSAEAIERTKATRFHKGNIPHNCYDEVGKITIRYDHKERGGRPYKYICLAIGDWKPLHTHLWEQEYGKVSKGNCLWFKDGDSLHCELDNLECITRVENVVRNSNHEFPSDKRIASYLATTSKKVDPLLREILLKYPELIEAKRTQILLNRKIKQNGTEQNDRP